MDIEAPGNDELTDEEGPMGSELPSLSPHDQTRLESDTGAIPFELHPNYKGIFSHLNFKTDIFYDETIRIPANDSEEGESDTLKGKLRDRKLHHHGNVGDDEDENFGVN